MIKDYKGEKLLLQNPDDKLNFPLSREKKKFQGIQIIKTIGLSFHFLSAMHYYISQVDTGQKKLYFDNSVSGTEDNEVSETQTIEDF